MPQNDSVGGRPVETWQTTPVSLAALVPGAEPPVDESGHAPTAPEAE